MRIADNRNWEEVDFETDFRVLWKEWADTQLPGILIRDVVLSIRSSVQLHPNWSFSWIPQRLNRLPHLLAKWSLQTNSFGFISVNSIPSALNFDDGFADFEGAAP